MRFEWIETEKWSDRYVVYSLYLVKDERPVRLMGTLIELPRAWRIREHGTNDMYWLDKDLSLAPSQRVEEAQRAAKLFLCVGRPGVSGRQ